VNFRQRGLARQALWTASRRAQHYWNSRLASFSLQHTHLISKNVEQPMERSSGSQRGPGLAAWHPLLEDGTGRLDEEQVRGAVCGNVG
jgi:hypothetical protein